MKIFSYFFIFILVASSFVTNGQTTFVSTGAGGNWSSGATWVGGVAPSSPCDNCIITIAPGATVTQDILIDLTGIAGPSILIIDGTGTLIVNQPLEFENSSQLIVGNNGQAASLIDNQEIDMITNSIVRLADVNSSIDASIPGPGTGLVNSGAGGSGIYDITGVGPVTSKVLLNSLGYFNPLPPPLYYSINCGAGFPNPCTAGIVYGPAVNGTIGAVATFVPFTPLPVELIKFAASLNSDQTISLSWTTEQEVNSNYFSVQRSSDGSNFQEIGKVKAKGISSITSNYSFTDPSLLNGTAYYRLQIFDLDGKYSDSKVITVSSDAQGNVVLVFNNPFTDQVRLQVNISATDKISLSLTDILGRSVLKEVFPAQAGSNFINLQPGFHALPGVYLLNIRSNTINKTIKLVKQDR